MPEGGAVMRVSVLGATAEGIWTTLWAEPLKPNPDTDSRQDTRTLWSPHEALQPGPAAQSGSGREREQGKGSQATVGAKEPQPQQ